MSTTEPLSTAELEAMKARCEKATLALVDYLAYTGDTCLTPIPKTDENRASGGEGTIESERSRFNRNTEQGTATLSTSAARNEGRKSQGKSDADGNSATPSEPGGSNDSGNAFTIPITHDHISVAGLLTSSTPSFMQDGSSLRHLLTTLMKSKGSVSPQLLAETVSVVVLLARFAGENDSGDIPRCIAEIDGLRSDLEVAKRALQKLSQGADHPDGVVAAEFYEGVTWAQDIANEALSKLSRP